METAIVFKTSFDKEERHKLRAGGVEDSHAL